ncbi:hypothetical protein [Lysinibacillus sphaericus]|uniref:hypothetical protein n=1 Tax=Lysinibacillus sphaericus TaxID=1421 RepID=UPI0018CFE91B|nr:hypothetical protein [Lysinibacillus sphaericus]
MVKLNNTFEFVGTLQFMKEPTKVTEFEKSGWTKKESKVMINESKANGVFLAIEGGYYASKGQPDVVKSYTKNLFGEKGGKLEVAWDDRNISTIVNKVADFSKTVIDLTTDAEAKEKYAKLRKDIWKIESNENATDEDKVNLEQLYKEVKETVPHRYEFLHMLDVVDFLDKYNEKLNGKKFKIKGDLKVSHWNGKFYTNYEPSHFELVDDEEPTKLALDLDLYFDKDVIDKTLFKSEKVMTFNTYILSYDSTHGKDVFFPLQTVLNASAYDLEDVKHNAHINIVEKFFTVKGKKVYQLPYSAKVISGSEIKEFSEADLTEDQKTLIEIGMATINDFKPKGLTFGDNLNEIRLLFPKIKDLGEGANFTAGAIETDFEVTELQYEQLERNTTVKDVKEEKNDTVESNPFDINEYDLPF